MYGTYPSLLSSVLRLLHRRRAKTTQSTPGLLCAFPIYPAYAFEQQEDGNKDESLFFPDCLLAGRLARTSHAPPSSYTSLLTFSIVITIFRTSRLSFSAAASLSTRSLRASPLLFDNSPAPHELKEVIRYKAGSRVLYIMFALGLCCLRTLQTQYIYICLLGI